MRRSVLASIAGAVLLAGAAQPASAAAWTWTGFYVGANAGYGWGRSDTVTTVPLGLLAPLDAVVATYSAAASPTVDSRGFTGGVQLGFNVQMSNLVFGVETDVNAFRLRGSADTIGAPPGFATLTSHTEVNTDWLFTLRPRVGFAAGQWLFYATGGLAVTDIKYSQTNTFTSSCGPFICVESMSASKTKAGWTAGGGIEAALGNGWSLKGEYLYVDFGSIGTVTGCDNIFCTAITHNADLRASIARLGVNYRFGMP